MLRRVLLLSLATAACGGDEHAKPDAPVTPDAPSFTGVFAIPLTTPDQSFWGPLLAIGSQSFMMDLDTGSTTTGVAAMGCTQCTGITPLYAPGTGATDSHQTASTSYADGSSWSGEIFADAVGFDHGPPNVTTKIVAINQQSTFFDSTNVYQGILGMGGLANAEPNTDSWFDLASTAGLTGVMAFELCSNGGTMWLGGFDATKAQGPMQYTPMYPVDNNQPFYAIDITGMKLGNTSVGTGATAFQKPVVDTGTTLFYLPTGIESATISALNASAGFKALFGANAMVQDDPNNTGIGCVTKAGVTPDMVDAMLPPLTLTMPAKGGGADITLTVKALESYMIDSGNGKYCLGIADGGTQDATTMGDVIMEGFITVIDVKNGQVGWALDAGCHPGARQPRDRATFHPHLPKPRRH
ncbi:MAG: hypothetical protein JO257_27565 [Deltaproteobacteria bacterium]|nr:hypothetical protein [Deltaproteobacteria bacterium]